MSGAGVDWPAWARRHRVAFEVAPLIELQRGEKVQVGFTLTLYAALPMDAPAGTERQEASRRLREEMAALLEAATPSDQGVARKELEPPRTAVLRPENELRPELALTWRIFHAEGYWQKVTDKDRASLARFEKQLAGMGLKPGRW